MTWEEEHSELKRKKEESEKRVESLVEAIYEVIPNGFPVEDVIAALTRVLHSMLYLKKNG